ncbi:MAG: hypothetical protein ACRDV3_11585, partial [Acidothermaceae bacterium]
RGLIRADADIDEVQRDWMVVTSGVISQQMSNAPDERFAKGRFVAALPGLVAMFARHYAASGSVTPRRRASNASKR